MTFGNLKVSSTTVGTMLVLLLTLLSAPQGATANAIPLTGRISGVELSEYPFPADLASRYGVTVDKPLLDAFARDYAQSGDDVSGRGIGPDVDDLFLWWLPSRLSGIVYGTQAPPAGVDLDPAKPRDLGKMLWLAHVYGYYLGGWVFAKVSEFADPANPASRIVLPDIALPDPLVGVHYDDLAESVRVAAAGSPREVMDRTRYTLRGDGRLFINNDFGMFGYDAGYLQLIMRDNKPRDVVPRVDFRFDRGRLLGAQYGGRQESYVTHARRQYQRAERAGAGVATRMRSAVQGSGAEPDLRTVQENHAVLGAGLWSTPLFSLQRWDAGSYGKLLRNAYYAVQQNEANCRAAVAAYALEDIDLGRRHLRASAIWRAFIGQYFTGLASPPGNGGLARFTYAR
ncbi:hypothetical protein AAFP35_14975 [Gordonia sp. CPCC 206044]|uniref:hypothetical protein n=1 Tax=Gordonia sp. CPCC 206044 TaxID=3140793 RepID=UPI003AF3362B